MPSIATFTVAPRQANLGNPVTLTWEVTGLKPTTRIQIFCNSAPLLNGLPPQGSQQVQPPQAGLNAYKILAKDGDDEDAEYASEQVAVQVKNPNQQRANLTIVANPASRAQIAQQVVRLNAEQTVRNPQHHWLTYETLYNLELFRRTNQKRRMGLYRMPLNRAKVFVCQGTKAPDLERLTAAFFPDLDPQDLLIRSSRDCPWQPRRNGAVDSLQSPGGIAASLPLNSLYLNTSVVMPYNTKDNGGDTRAIGTRETTAAGTRLIQLNRTWDMWNTASRSCVVRISRVKEKGIDHPWRPPAGGAAPGAVPIDRIEATGGQWVWPWGAGEKELDEAADSLRGEHFDLASAAGCYSVKVGVEYIGKQYQGKGNGDKDELEANSIDACLRSDLIWFIDNRVGHDPAADKHLIVLKELLSVTEDIPSPDGHLHLGDGFQVRDLSVLDKSKVYFPPLSIPYVDRKFTDLKARYEALPVDLAWGELWLYGYAKALGVAKALFLLRYALQMGSPNAQNFLIEFNADMTPTGRIVFRDVGDAQLHREVAWALFGPQGEDPPVGSGDAAWPAFRRLDNPILQFEADWLWRAKGYIMETGTADPQGQYGNPGTQFRWTNFSSLSKGRAVADGNAATDARVRAEGWQRVLAMNAAWGLEHNVAFVETIQDCLGIPIPIDWDAGRPSWSRYLSLADDDYAAAGVCYREDLAWDEEQAALVHEILRSRPGQAAIREYHARRWQPRGVR
jgi:hypothetical protein